MDFGPHLFLAMLEGTITAAVLALTAVGLSIVFGIMRVVNVAHGEFFMLGVVLAWWIASLVGGHPAVAFSVALLMAPLLTGILAAVADRLVLRRINYDPERTIVATIGLLYVVQQATLMTFGPEARPEATRHLHRIHQYFARRNGRVRRRYPGHDQQNRPRVRRPLKNYR